MSIENALLPRVWELERSLGQAGRVNDSLRKTIERQAAQIEMMREAKIDAERYRWLRNALTDRSKNGVSHHFCSISSGHPEELDDSIDAAIAAAPKGEVK